MNQVTNLDGYDMFQVLFAPSLCLSSFMQYASAEGP